MSYRQWPPQKWFSFLPSNMFPVNNVFCISYFLSLKSCFPYLIFFLSLPWLISFIDYFTNFLVFLTTSQHHTPLHPLSVPDTAGKARRMKDSPDSITLWKFFNCLQRLKMTRELVGTPDNSIHPVPMELNIAISPESVCLVDKTTFLTVLVSPVVPLICLLWTETRQYDSDSQHSCVCEQTLKTLSATDQSIQEKQEEETLITEKKKNLTLYLVSVPR